MKRIAFALGLVAATMTAAPLAAQQRNDGPWWDPANTGGRSGSTRVDTRDGRIYNDGRVMDTRRADGQWRREGRDRSGNILYVRTRYDANGNLIQERARRDTFGRYRVVDRRVIQYANRRNDRRDNDRNNDGWYDRDGRGRNDRWDQNNGHDNGKHNGQHKNKHKGKNKR
jgi:hypothetical protein